VAVVSLFDVRSPPAAVLSTVGVIGGLRRVTLIEHREVQRESRLLPAVFLARMANAFADAPFLVAVVRC